MIYGFGSTAREGKVSLSVKREVTPGQTHEFYLLKSKITERNNLLKLFYLLILNTYKSII
jgi:hypothetical protein